ncbi:helix-turn-helix transcriptional regulator [Bifidobacterium longum]
MKQSDLADLVNVRRETIGRLEQGQYCPSLAWPWIWRGCSAPP